MNLVNEEGMLLFMKEFELPVINEMAQRLQIALAALSRRTTSSLVIATFLFPQMRQLSINLLFIHG
jgi:hypothetical protein